MSKVVFEKDSKSEKVLKIISIFQLVLFSIVIISIIIGVFMPFPAMAMILLPVCFFLFAASIVIELVVIIYYLIKNKTKKRKL